MHNYLLTDVMSTFGHIEAIAAIEDVHHGPAANKVRWAADGPVSPGWDQPDTAPAPGILPGSHSPTAICASREAVDAAVLLAVADSVEAAAVQMRFGERDWRAEIDEAAAEYVRQLRE